MVEHIVPQVLAEAHGGDGGAVARQSAEAQGQDAHDHQQQAGSDHIAHIGQADAVVQQPAHIEGDEDIQHHFHGHVDRREDGRTAVFSHTGQ